MNKYVSHKLAHSSAREWHKFAHTQRVYTTKTTLMIRPASTICYERLRCINEILCAPSLNQSEAINDFISFKIDFKFDFCLSVTSCRVEMSYALECRLGVAVFWICFVK